MTKSIIALLLLISLNVVADTCSTPPPGKWKFEDGNVAFCILVQEREICSPFPLRDYMDYLKGRLIDHNVDERRQVQI